jgi:hypothetical protein
LDGEACGLPRLAELFSNGGHDGRHLTAFPGD